MRIKKISPTTPANGNIENQYGTSQTNAYSEAYINSAIPTKTSDLTNDSNFATTDVATTSANGLMSATDKVKLNGINYKHRYFLSPLSKGPTQYYFGTVSFPYDVGNTDYTVTLSSSQGGYTYDTSKFTITKYTFGFRIFTSEAAYDGLIIEAVVS